MKTDDGKSRQPEQAKPAGQAVAGAQDAQTARPTGRKRRRARLAMVALLLALLVIPGCALYNCAARRTLNKEITQTPRDPITGVALGCESLDIAPAPGTFSGDQPTTACLLIHGFLGSRNDMADLGDQLAARGFHVRIPRLPGHGTTPVDYAAQTPETMYEGVLEEYQALSGEFDAVYVAGFSMGGALGTLLAAREDVDRLVLIAPYYGVAYMWYYGLPAETWNAMMGRFIPYVIKSDAFIKVNRPEAKKELFSYHAVPTNGAKTLIRLGEAAREPATLAAIDCPVLMVIAEGDEASSPQRARTAFALIGSADKTAHWLDKRNNHHILWDYDREEAKATILEFLAGE